jgi:hypothetical protein
VYIICSTILQVREVDDMSLTDVLSGKKRLNLVVPKRAIERLDWLQARTDAASHTEVIRHALFVYEQLVERLSAGSKLMEKTPKGELLPLPVSIDIAGPRLVSDQGMQAAG